MKTVGEILEHNRILNNLSIDEIANELKISKDILLRLEKDNINIDKDIVFYIGHLRSYCNFMELDTPLIIERFKKQISFKVILPEEISKPSFNNNIVNVKKISSASLILIIFFSFYFLFINEDNNTTDYALVPDLPESLEPIIEETNLELSLNKDEQKENKMNNFLETLNSSSTVAKIEPEIFDVKDELVTLKLLNATWIQLRDKNDNIVISKLMDKDEEYSYKISLGYNITAGNAGNILVLINNNVRGKIGKYGEVIDSLILDSNFKN